MHQTFINLPQEIEKTIGELLSHEDRRAWVSAATTLHERYTNREGEFLQNFNDALAYVALRFPATYAQIAAAMQSVQEMLPAWQPRTMLDLGSGPGTGVFVAQAVWTQITSATCVDINKDLLQLGTDAARSVEIPTEITWQQKDFRNSFGEQSYDLVILANVLNELRKDEIDKVVGKAFNACNGVLLIVEPGTEYGNHLVSSIAKKFADVGYLIAPYVQNSFVQSNDYWIHFSQRFIRPKFQRSLRQHLRDSALMASDWEDAKYCYIAISKIPSGNNSWGRVIGPVKKQKGYLEVPILTKEEIVHTKVMKRHREQYNFAKELAWGELITREALLVSTK